MGRAKRLKVSPADTAQRTYTIVNPNAQRHTMTVASIHFSQKTVHIAYSATTKSQLPWPAKPVLLTNDTLSTDPETEMDLEDFTCIKVPEEVGQT